MDEAQRCIFYYGDLSLALVWIDAECRVSLLAEYLCNSRLPESYLDLLRKKCCINQTIDGRWVIFIRQQFEAAENPRDVGCEACLYYLLSRVCLVHVYRPVFTQSAFVCTQRLALTPHCIVAAV